MFCFQCEQTAKCAGCTGAMGVCGKREDTAQLQDRLTGSLIGLARATEGNEHFLSDSTAAVVVEGLFAIQAMALSIFSWSSTVRRFPE